MFRFSEDSDDDDAATCDRIARLAKKRNRDSPATYEKESYYHATNTRKPSALSESDDSVSDREDRRRYATANKVKNVSSHSQAKPLGFAERMMAKMGHKAGEGLGKEGKGIVKSVDISTQLKRLSLGHEGSKVRFVSGGIQVTQNASANNDKQASSHNQAKPLGFAERMMAKMGHKAGEGLGKEGKGIVKSVDISTQLKRLSLGHEGSKVRFVSGGIQVKQNASANNDKQASSHNQAKPLDFAARMMAKMGYKDGEGLGKEGKGIVEPIGLYNQRGRLGLGHEGRKTIGRDSTTTRDEFLEEKTVEETPIWIARPSDSLREETAQYCETDEWMVIAKKKMTIDDEDAFCNREVLLEMLSSKDVFDTLTDCELREARARVNSYETIGGAFFQNRAAMLAANMDKVFDWIFSQEDKENLIKKNPIDKLSKAANTDRDRELFYFADICACPGGFSEYMLWRKGFYNCKGFGFTLRGKDDFKLGKFTASSAHLLEQFYGVHEDGNIMDPENIDSLEEFIMKGTGSGVHLVMADGGFSVDGQENIQEILSKRLYLCQFLVSLCILRDGGNFFCKLFDIFTPFSAGLVYLMYICYDEVSLHKPHTSRPANSERYIVCKNLKREYSARVKKYLKTMNRMMDELTKKGSSLDVMSCVPMDVMQADQDFFDYLKEHNERFALRQKTYLNKYVSFAKNQGLLDRDQGDLRVKCLQYWMVPDKQRSFNRDRRQTLNPEQTIGIYAPTMVLDKDLDKYAANFTIDAIANPSEKQLKYAEYSCCLLTERLGRRSRPRILVSTGDVVFIRTERWEQYDSSELRVPDKTILLVEEATSYKFTVDGKLEETRDKIIRILDAGVLHGEDVSKLSYAHRMKAAKKFCKALNLVNETVRIDLGQRERKATPRRLVVADTFGIEKFINIQSDKKFAFANQKESSLLLFEENDRIFACHAVRFARILAGSWKMAFSRSQKMKYAFQPGKVTVFERDFEKHEGISASFWDVCCCKMTTEKQIENNRLMHRWWKWENSQEDDYGHRPILDRESHRSGPTLSEIQRIVEDTDRKCKR